MVWRDWLLPKGAKPASSNTPPDAAEALPREAQDIRLGVNARTDGHTNAWLESKAKQLRSPIFGTCSIGRARDNTLVIQHERVSRRHALVHAQAGEYWIVDLGSSNGTFLNGKRLHAPSRLANGNTLMIAGHEITFRQIDGAAMADPTQAETHTEMATLCGQSTIEETEMWLLVADIEKFTTLSHEIPAATLAPLVGSWLHDCKQLVEGNRGQINKYLGDGFLAYWRHEKGIAEQVAKTLGGMKVHQEKHGERLPFRFVLHFGKVTVGGASMAGEEGLLSADVNFVFRAEKLASRLGERALVSATAKKHLPSATASRSVGQHHLTGFPNASEFFVV